MKPDWNKMILPIYTDKAEINTTIEALYQSFKKRLMNELVPGLSPLDETGASSGILMDKPNETP